MIFSTLKYVDYLFIIFDIEIKKNYFIDNNNNKVTSIKFVTFYFSGTFLLIYVDLSLIFPLKNIC